MLGIMNDYEALFSKAPPSPAPARPQIPLVETASTNKRSLLADHRYQLEFLLADVGLGGAAYCSPIGRNQAAFTAPKDHVVGPQNEDSPQISPIFSVNNNTPLFNNVNFFDYETSCEPISPIKIQDNIFLNQNQQPNFDFTPNFPSLYTNQNLTLHHQTNSTLHQTNSTLHQSKSTLNEANFTLHQANPTLHQSNSTLHQTGSTLHQSDSSSSLNSIDIDCNSSPSQATPTIFDSDSSNPVWQDRFLNINELLLPHAIDFVFHDPMFPLGPFADDHVTPTTDDHVTVISSDHVTNDEAAAPRSFEDEGSLLSYYRHNQGHVEILTNQETVPFVEEAELMEKTGHVTNGAVFDQSQLTFKNQQEIFDEIYRECEQRVKKSRDSSISDHEVVGQSIDASFLGQPIINLDLDDVQPITPPPPLVFSSPKGRKKRSRDPNSATPTPSKKKSPSKKIADVVDLGGVVGLNSAHLSIDVDSPESSDESYELSSNFDNSDDLDVKKKKQNRRAASKYRTKRKKERINVETERNRLEEENRKLKSIVDDRQREIDYLKNFLNEIRASKAAKKS